MVEPPGRIGGALRLPHVDIAALLKNELRQLFVGDLIRLSPPPIEVVEHAPQNLTGTRFQFLGFNKRTRRARQGKTGSAAIFVQNPEGRFAKASFGLVIDTLEGEVVVGLGDAPKVGQRMAYFGPLIESWAADDLVRQAQGDETLLEFAHLKGGANQDGDVVETNAFVLGRFNLLADEPCFPLPLPPFSASRPIPGRLVGEQRLPQATAIVGDQSRRNSKDEARL